MRREDIPREPLLDDDDDDIPLLGRTPGRPDPLPMDGFHEVEEMSTVGADESGDSDEVSMTMQISLQTSESLAATT